MPFSPPAILVTDRRAVPRGELLGAVEAALAGGIRCVQLREKDLPGGELLRLAARMRELTARFGALLLVNDRVDVAMAAGADGVHLGVASIPPEAARRLLGPRAVVGCSTHSAAEVRAAEAGGADYATFGPVWATPSKAAYGAPVGLDALAEASRAARLPLYALGGVRADRAGVAREAGAAGVACIRELLSAPDPAEAARNLISCIHMTDRKVNA